jgi:hypothetical protein
MDLNKLASKTGTLEWFSKVLSNFLAFKTFDVFGISSILGVIALLLDIKGDYEAYYNLILSKRSFISFKLSSVLYISWSILLKL